MATSVFVVAITALIASVGHLVQFVQTGGSALNTVLSLVIPSTSSGHRFTVPGVILGGQLGSRVASRVPQRTLERGLSILFILVAVLPLGEVVL